MSNKCQNSPRLSHRSTRSSKSQICPPTWKLLERQIIYIKQQLWRWPATWEQRTVIPGRREANEVCPTITLAYYLENLQARHRKQNPVETRVSMHGGLGAISPGTSEQLKTTGQALGRQVFHRENAKDLWIKHSTEYQSDEYMCMWSATNSQGKSHLKARCWQRTRKSASPTNRAENLIVHSWTMKKALASIVGQNQP